MTLNHQTAKFSGTLVTVTFIYVMSLLVEWDHFLLGERGLDISPRYAEYAIYSDMYMHSDTFLVAKSPVPSYQTDIQDCITRLFNQSPSSIYIDQMINKDIIVLITEIYKDIIVLITEIYIKILSYWLQRLSEIFLFQESATGSKSPDDEFLPAQLVISPAVAKFKVPEASEYYHMHGFLDKLK